MKLCLQLTVMSIYQVTVVGPGNEKTCLRVKFSIFLFSWKYEYWNIRSPEKNFGHNLAIKSGSESQKRTI